MLIIQSIVVFILLVGVVSYLFKFSQNRTKSKLVYLDKTDKWIIFVLSLIYAAMSFIHFADTNQYDHPWHGVNPGDQIILTLTTPTPLSAFYYSTGFIKGKYTISAMSNSQSAILLDDKNAKLGYPPYFRWNKISFDGKTLVSSITLHVDHGPVDITKFALVDKNGQIFSKYVDSQFTVNNPRVVVGNDSLNNSLGNDSARSNLISAKLPEDMDDNWRSSTVFDEIYYATSAYQYLHSMPPDVWVHPQFGIYFIIIGILIFGMSPLGWRIMPNVASILLVPLIYMFAKRVFKNRKIAIAASILLMFEFMHYTISREASLEPFVTLFLTLEYYFLYSYVDSRMLGVNYKVASRNLLYSAIFFGLAFSSKWNALYSALMILLCLIYCELIRNKVNWWQFVRIVINSALLFILLPLLIYLIIYIPFALINHYNSLLQPVYQIQLGILDFNLHGLTHATHPYASNWWSWPLDIMPLSVYYWTDASGYMSSSMALLGNPALYWMTWVTIVLLAYNWIKVPKNYRAGFLLLAIITLYLPYAFVARISFIYYFYSVTPFLILGVCYLLNQLLCSGKKVYTYMVYSYLTLNIGLFLLFFPTLSGIEVPRSYTVNMLLWLPGWNF